MNTGRYRLPVMLALLILLGVGSAAAGPTGSRVNASLMALHEEYVAHVARQSALPFATRNLLTRVADDRVVVDAVADGDVRALEAALASLGMRHIAVFGRVISGELPLLAIPALETIASLRFARAAAARQRTGSVSSLGDQAIRAGIARSAFGVTGAGVQVGVLSDSFDCLRGAAKDIASNDLSPVTVLQEISDCGDGTDEGRAILQIVHDIAPGASLSFASAFNGTASFAANIIALKNNGAKVILDDIFYANEPMFQDGIITQAVDTVVAQGAAFFTAAGNDARRSYESAFRAGSTFADGAFPSAPGAPHFFGGIAHNFAPSGPADHMQRLTIGSGRTAFISLQWDSPFFSVSGRPGSPNDIDVYLLNAAATRVVAGSANPDLGGDAVEIVTFTNNGPTADFNLMIVNNAGPNPGFIKYIQLGGSGTTIAEFDTASSTIFGHANAAGAASVGAAFYGDTPAFGVTPPLLESYSSAGPTRILFDTAGHRLVTPIIRAKPEIVAPDGGDTTVFAPFFGTSAAAPHAAGVAALMLQQKPGLSPGALYSALETTAIDMGTPGFNFDSGFGLIQADAALQAVSTPNISLALTLNRHTVATGDSVQASFSATNTGTSALQDLYFLLLPPPALSTSLGCPQGDALVFLGNSFATIVTRCAKSALPQSFVPLFSSRSFPVGAPAITLPNLLSLVWPAGLPSGTYTWVVFTTQPNAFADGIVGPTDVTGITTDSFRTSP